MIRELIDSGIKLTVCKDLWTLFIAIPVNDRNKSKKVIREFSKGKGFSPKYFIDYDNGCLELELTDSLNAEEYGRACEYKKSLRKEVRQLVKDRVLKVCEVSEFRTIYRPEKSLF